ncbi:MFS transporter [Corynebacterium pelargi]|uniref:Inner membrane transport protein YnfM n=1 Tax=Corynebacterium pelargi TaxID=1471400 RepID=A0A410W5Y7_9CORY|nr:MFS transporter [Corynebacterium pelargi]QAU51448.1 Inner membrane transport protein YnfM [Corynebacterium pelargi]GGG79235.1 transporter [Corynebacterium pelargi]
MSDTSGLRRGTADYRRAVIALLAAGLATFNALYCTQAMLPTLTHALDVSPTTAALTISAPTGALALCIVPASILSERFGRGKVLIISALLATLVGLALPLAQNAPTLVALRGLQGVFIAGVPAVAMTWLSEEIAGVDQPRAMGIYISGNALGGLLGRMIPALLLEVTSWRWALFAATVLAFVMAVLMAWLLPYQRRFHPRALHLREEIAAMVGHWRRPELALLFFFGFAGLGVFVSLYNYVGFRMIHTFGLSEALVGLVFLLYLAGSWSSARAGAWMQRVGRGPALTYGAVAMVLGLLLSMPAHLWLTLFGMLVFTAAFFFVHSTASSWVGRIATHHRAEGASMYLLSYYVGSSVLGWLSGYLFASLSWVGFIAAIMVWPALLVAASLLLRHKAS